MKKIISLILAVVFVLGGISVPIFAAESNESIKIERLSALGIIHNMNAVEFDSSKEVIKKAFYEAVYGIVTDEEKTDSAVINLLKRYRIELSAEEFGDVMTRREALQAVVCVMGYPYGPPKDEELKKLATWLDILGNLRGSLDDAITVGEMVNIIYAAAFNNMLSISPDSYPGAPQIELLEDKSPLEYYRDIYEVRGYVNKNGYASVVDNRPVSKGHICIDDECFKTGSTNAGDYLGMPVISFVKYSDDEGEILYIELNKNRATTVTIDADDIISVDDEIKNIQYDLGTRIKKAELSAAVKVIYNGKNCTDYVKNDLIPTVGDVELIDSDNDRKIDVIKVRSYETVLVDYVSAHNNMIKSKYNNSAVYSLDDYTDVYIEKDEKEIELSEIKANDILLFAKSKSGSDELVRIYVSDKQVTGVIKNINYSARNITVDDKTYNLSKDYITAINDTSQPFVKQPETGKNYCIYIDSMGNVAYAVSLEGSSYIYAYKIWKDAADENVIIKAINTEGEWKQYTLAKKLNYNNFSSRQTNDKVYEALGGASGFAHQLLRVELNAEGNIKKLETSELSDKYDENTFTRYQMPYLRIYSKDAMTFGDDVHGMADTKVFILPTDSSRITSEAYVTGMSYFKLDSRYRIDAYDIDKFYRAPVIVYTSDDKDADSNATVITDIYEAVINDEVKTVIECLQDGKINSFAVSDSYQLPDIKEGDVIKTALNTIGEISYIEVLNKLEKDIVKQYPDQSDPASIHKSNVVAAGTIEEIGIQEEMFLADCGTFTARLRILGTTQIYLYDGEERNNKVRKVTLSELMPGDNVYVYIGWAKVGVVYAMRNVQ